MDNREFFSQWYVWLTIVVLVVVILLQLGVIEKALLVEVFDLFGDFIGSIVENVR